MIDAGAHRRKVLSSTLWSALLQWSRIGLNAVVFLIVSRWLSLWEIGAFAAAQAPALYVNTLQRSVIPDAVVQQRDRTSGQTSTLFWMSVAIGSVCSGGLALIGWAVAIATPEHDVGEIIMALSLAPLILSLSAVSEGVMRENMDYRRLTIRTVIATAIAAAPTLWLAGIGYGSWALVAFLMLSTTIASALTFHFCDWRPTLQFDRAFAGRSIKLMVLLAGRYGISAAVFPCLQFFVSASLGLSAGGAFQIAQRLLSLLDGVVTTPVRSVALPVFARVKDQPQRFGRGVLEAVTYSSVLTAPIYLGLAAVAPLALPLAVGPTNGLASVEVFQIMSLYGLPGMVTGILTQALVSQGWTAETLTRTVLVTAVTLMGTAVAVWWSLEAMAWTYVLAGGWLGMAFVLVITQQRCSLPLQPLLSSIALPFGASLVMSASVTALLRFMAPPQSPYATALLLAGAILLGVVVYGAMIVFTMRRTLAGLTDRLRAAEAPQKSAA